MAGIKIFDLPPLGRDLASTDLLELSLAGGTGSRKITGQEIMNTSKLNIGTTAITSGTVGRVLFQGTGNVVQESGNLFWDNTNGTLEATTTADNFFGLRLKSTTGQLRVKPYLNSTYGVLLESKNAADSAYLPMSFSSSKHLFLDGNVIINSTSDAGFRLDVNGTARVSGATTISSGLGAVGTFALGVTGSSGNLFYVRGFGDAFLASNLWLGAQNGQNWIGAGNMGIYSGSSAGQTFFSIRHNNGNFGIRVQTNSNVCLNETAGNVLIGTTTDAGYRLDVNGTARLNASSGNDIITDATNVTLNGYAGSGSVIRFQSRNAAAALIYKFVVPNNNDTAAYFTGNVGIGTASPQEKLDINGSLRIRLNSSNLTAVQDTSVIDYVNTSIFTTTPALRISAVGTTSIAAQIRFLAGTATEMNAGTAERMRIFGGGNIGINTTTDAGYKLDVNGTARVSGAFSALNASTQGIMLRNDYTQFPAIEWWATTYKAGITRETNNGLTTDAGGFAMHTVGAGTLIGGVNRFDLNASAQLQVQSTTKGFLPPRMTQTQRNAIASPDIGLEIYQTDATEGKYIYKSSGWTYIG